ncbi:sensor histidine kinase [Sulfurivermis fontis]|uniref:sensor histidine kinase n=1 Tax=Sulfurivermis fontis TaxID=1972068 RepID=UPI000FDAE0D0|nr:sensor histidine kinase [Sulfurivermis fontis]
MQFSLSLRLRVATGFALLCVAVSLALGGWVYFTSRDLEERLIDEALAAELEDYKARLARNPQSLPPLTATVRGYLLPRSASPDELPAALRVLSAGYHTLDVEGTSYRVAVSASDHWTLYMLHSRAQVEYRERRLIAVVLFGIIATALLSAAGGWWLAGRVIAPVGELARRVRERDAADLVSPFAEGLPHDEVGELAHAFERYLARMLAFVERERAFAADASHELRTPLAVIQGAVEVLQADPQLDPKMRPRVERMARAVRGMADLTSTLLMLARERPGPAPAFTPCPVDEVLREVIEQHQHLLQHKPVQLELHIEARPEVAVERPLLAIALGNLVRNAFAYTEQGQVAITLTGTDITVADTGPGVPPEDLCCLFEHTAHSRRATRGAGIGLPLVKRIADRQGWRVSVSSAAGQGATFRLVFRTQP